MGETLNQLLRQMNLFSDTLKTPRAGYVKDYRNIKTVHSNNRRNCSMQYGKIVPPSKWKSQSLIGKVIASLQRLLEALVPIETWD